MHQSYKDADWLSRKYSTDKLSCRKIGGLCGVSGKTIYKWLKIYEIPVRSLKDSMAFKSNRFLSPEELDRLLHEAFRPEDEIPDELLDEILENC